MCVEDLRLKNLQLGDDAADRFLRSIEHVPSVKHLDLSFNVLGAAAMAPLAGCAFTLHLESLDLSGNEIGTDGARALCAADLPELRTLDLSWCELVDSAVHAIAGARCMPSLQNLTLRRNNLTDAGGAALAASAHLRVQLLRLSIDYNDGMTAKGRKLLRAAFDVVSVLTRFEGPARTFFAGRPASSSADRGTRSRGRSFDRSTAPPRADLTALWTTSTTSS